jgi:hypothetical protein
MKKVWIVILGVLNILACGSLLLYDYVWFSEKGASLSTAFTGGLPVLIAAALALTGGIYALKRKSWKWAVSGLVVAGAAWMYCLTLAWWINYWSMA